VGTGYKTRPLTPKIPGATRDGRRASRGSSTTPAPIGSVYVRPHRCHRAQQMILAIQSFDLSHSRSIIVHLILHVAGRRSGVRSDAEPHELRREHVHGDSGAVLAGTDSQNGVAVRGIPPASLPTARGLVQPSGRRQVLRGRQGAVRRRALPVHKDPQVVKRFALIWAFFILVYQNIILSLVNDKHNHRLTAYLPAFCLFCHLAKLRIWTCSSSASTVLYSRASVKLSSTARCTAE